jgi:hypothetical protein
MYSNTERAILDFLYAKRDFLPVTKDSPEVEWLYTTPHGSVYGLTNELAQSICIIAERCNEMFCGGFLQYVKGRKFAKCDCFEL